MAISLKSVSSDITIAPPRVMIYGPQGVGKTTFGASAPNPIMVPVEDGMGHLGIPSFPLLTTYEQVMEALYAVLTEQHDYSTLVLDSIDWLEPLVWRYTCSRFKKSDIEDFGYGKGYISALDDWRVVLQTLSDIRMKRGMAVVIVSHAHVKKYDDPTAESYDRYQIKLHDRASALLEEWCDAILFLNHRISVAKDDAGFNKTRKRGVGTGERVIYTEERPAFKAKNRYDLPAEIECPNGGGWAVFQAAMLESISAAKQRRQPQQATKA